MPKPVYPGARCEIIGSANGPKGPSVGRHCTALYLHQHQHSLWGNIWRVGSVDGSDFVSEHGGVGPEVDCAEDWLRVIEDDQTQSTETETKEVAV